MFTPITCIEHDGELNCHRVEILTHWLSDMPRITESNPLKFFARKDEVERDFHFEYEGAGLTRNLFDEGISLLTAVPATLQGHWTAFLTDLYLIVIAMTTLLALYNAIWSQGAYTKP